MESTWKEFKVSYLTAMLTQSIDLGLFTAV